MADGWDEEVLRVAASTASSMSRGDTHTVACAVRDDRGVIHVAMNVYHFTGGPCAELAALGAAAAAGAVTVRSMVAVGRGGHEILTPCGRCRQVLLDTHPEVRVMLPGDVTASPEELLPFHYQWQRDGQSVPYGKLDN